MKNSQQEPGKVYFFAGKMAAGKSTLSKLLATENNAVLISEDELLAALYPGEIKDVASYSRYSGRVKLALQKVIVDSLSGGQNVVLDFPANTVKQREWMREIVNLSGARHELHFVDSTDEICKTQLLKRASEDAARASTDTVEMFDAISKYFEPPAEEEGFTLIVHRRC